MMRSPRARPLVNRELMSRRTTVDALVLTLIVLVAPPAAAKGPTDVRVHDLRTGATTLVDFAERGELGALVSWGRTSGYAFHAVLSEIQQDVEGTTATIVAPAAGPTRDPGRQPSPGFDAVSFALGAGLTGPIAAGLVLAVSWRGRRAGA